MSNKEWISDKVKSWGHCDGTLLRNETIKYEVEENNLESWKWYEINEIGFKIMGLK